MIRLEALLLRNFILSMQCLLPGATAKALLYLTIASGYIDKAAKEAALTIKASKSSVILSIFSQVSADLRYLSSLFSA